MHYTRSEAKAWGPGEAGRPMDDDDHTLQRRGRARREGTRRERRARPTARYTRARILLEHGRVLESYTRGALPSDGARSASCPWSGAHRLPGHGHLSQGRRRHGPSSRSARIRLCHPRLTVHGDEDGGAGHRLGHRVAEQVDIGVAFYNSPQFGIVLSAKALARMADIATLIAIKEASFNLQLSIDTHLEAGAKAVVSICRTRRSFSSERPTVSTKR